MDCEDDEDSHLNSSELGTKKFWDDAYDRELNNYNDHGDIGEVWFGEESVLRLVNWLNSNYTGSKSDPIVDLGCGNGMMLVELAREGFKNLTGYDYSEQAIQLASSIIKKQEMYYVINLQVCDLISPSLETSIFSIVLDKGTYDAICLNPSNAKENRMIYMKNVHKMLEPSGLFIITSCNWSDNELISQFNPYFKLNSVIPTPEFKFGGRSGKLVSSLVLQRLDCQCC